MLFRNLTGPALIMFLVLCVTTKHSNAQDFLVKSTDLDAFFYNRVFCVDDQNVWIGTDRGVAKLNKSTWELTDVEGGLQVDSVESIIRDYAGRIWALGGYGFDVWDGQKWAHRASDFLFASYFEAAGNSVWWFSGPFGQSFKQITSTDTIEFIGSMTDVEYGSSIGYWAIDSHTVYSLQSGIWQADTTSDDYFTGIHIDSQENLWLTGYSYTAETFKIWKRRSANTYEEVSCPFSLKDAQIQTITSDSKGNLYLGSLYKGVFVRTGQNHWYQIDSSNGSIFDEINAIEVDDSDNVWIYSSGSVQNGNWWEPASKITALLDQSSNENRLSGVIYSDANSNGKRDVEEPGVPNILVHLQPSNSYSITNANGVFSYRPANGTNTITTLTKGFWEKGVTPLGYGFKYPDSSPEINIGLKWSTVHDVAVSLTSTPARPGFDVVYFINVRNEGSTALSTKLSVSFNPALTLLNSTLPPSIVNDNVLEWNINELPSLQSVNFAVTFNLSATTPLGTVLETPFSVSMLDGETDLTDNAGTSSVTVTGSLDPNDKLVAEGIFEERYVKLGSELNYTIRFQNTGTDTAFVIKILDELDPHFDITTLEVLASSHAVNYSLQNRTLKFVFDNIKLPDSTRNEPASHGYVKYRIKPYAATLNNTVVTNTADIYFDFNEPVRTNEVSNTYVLELPDGTITGVDDNIWKASVVFPNPTKGELTISAEASLTFARGELLSSDGKRIKTFTLIPGEPVELRNIQSGIYLLRLSGSKGLITKKIVVAE